MVGAGVLLAIVAIVAATQLGPRAEPTTAGVGSAEVPITPRAAASPSATASPAAPGGTAASSSTAPTLPAAGSGNLPFPGSPELVLFQRDGDDLNVLGWRTGETQLRVRQVIAGALRGITEQQGYAVLLSPDGSLVMIEAPPTTLGAPITLRVFRLDSSTGSLAWESTDFPSELSASFVGPEQVLVGTTGLFLQAPSPWTVVDLAGADPVIREVAVPEPPRPSPGASPGATVDITKVIFNYGPVGMSQDGRFLYAGELRLVPPILRPAFRIEIATGKATPIDAFPFEGPSAVMSSSIDPVSGRLVLAGPRMTPGEGTIQMWSPGAKEPDFETKLHVVLGAFWLDDGSVLTADYDKLPGPFTFSIDTISSTGGSVTTIFTAKGTNAAILGARDGFVAAYATSRGSSKRTLVVIRLDDGAISTLDVAEPPGLLSTYGGIRP